MEERIMENESTTIGEVVVKYLPILSLAIAVVYNAAKTHFTVEKHTEQFTEINDRLKNIESSIVDIRLVDVRQDAELKK